jgi:hypothetical protein
MSKEKKVVESAVDAVFDVIKDTAKLDNPVLATSIVGLVLKVTPVGIPTNVIVAGVVGVGAIALTVEKLVENAKGAVTSTVTTVKENAATGTTTKTVTAGVPAPPDHVGIIVAPKPDETRPA